MWKVYRSGMRIVSLKEKWHQMEMSRREVSGSGMKVKSMSGVREVSMRRGDGSEHKVRVMEGSMRWGEGSEDEVVVKEVSMRLG